MTADRFFFPAVLVACAALTALSAAEPARVAQTRADARLATAPVVQLERVTITAPRLGTGHQVANATEAEERSTTVR